MASPRATQPNQPAEAWRIMRWRSRHWAHREQLAEGVGAEHAHLENNTILTNHAYHSIELMITVIPHVLIDYKQANKKAPNRAGAMMSLPKQNHS
jgi:hypothetical protein